jgi:SAM-dependent methyltransferase
MAADAPRSPAAAAAAAAKVVLLPHMGMGDMLVLRGMVGALCARHERVVVVGLRRYRDSLAALFDLPNVAIALVDDAEDISPAFGCPDAAALKSFTDEGYSVLALGDHSGSGEWRALDPRSWKRALYLHAGMDPALMRDFELPKGRAPQAAAMLAKVRDIVGDGTPFVLVHDDPERSLRLPAELGDASVRVLHVDDARFASDVIFDYAEVLRAAAGVHAIDSCFAILAGLAAPGVPVTVHAYAKDASATGFEDGWTVLRAPPARGLLGCDLLPADDMGRALAGAWRHFVQLQAIMRATRHEWAGCGSYLMGPESMDYDPRVLPKQRALWSRAAGAGNVLEVGVHGGHSALLMLLASPGCRITCVDLCGWTHTAECVRYLQAQFPGRVTLLKGDSADVLPLIEGDFDLVHLDGEHTYEKAVVDIRESLRVSRPGATFVVDDYHDGVKRAVDGCEQLRIVEVPSCPWQNCVAVREAPAPAPAPEDAPEETSLTALD